MEHSDDRPARLSRSLAAICWLLAASLASAVLAMTVPGLIRIMRYVFPVLGAALLFEGLAILIMVHRQKPERKAKKFLILTGISSMGIVVGAVLHNLVYALFILLFGEGFWGEGGDEPVFFILSAIVFPLGLAVGLIGTAVSALRKK